MPSDAHAGHASTEAAERAALAELGEPGRARRPVHGHHAVPHRPYGSTRSGSGCCGCSCRSSSRSPGSPFGASSGQPPSRSGRRSWAASASRSRSPSSSPSGSRSCSRSPSGPAMRSAHDRAARGRPTSCRRCRRRIGMSLGEAIASVAFAVFVIVAIVWMQLATPIVIEGTAYPLFDPTTWTWLLWYVLALMVGGDRVRGRALPARPLDVGLRDRQCDPRRRVRDPRGLPRAGGPAAERRARRGDRRPSGRRRLVQDHDGNHGRGDRADHGRSTRSTGSARRGAPPAGRRRSPPDSRVAPRTDAPAR